MELNPGDVITVQVGRRAVKILVHEVTETEVTGVELVTYRTADVTTKVIRAGGHMVNIDGRTCFARHCRTVRRDAILSTKTPKVIKC